MTYIYMVFHYPEPGHGDELLRGMAGMTEITAAAPASSKPGPGHALPRAEPDF